MMSYVKDKSPFWRGRNFVVLVFLALYFGSLLQHTYIALVPVCKREKST